MKCLYAWLGLLLLAGIGCTPKIGRNCSNSLDCSLQGSRICDLSQPHGYCTIAGCEQGTCPSEAVCVKFRASEERLAVTYCMATCNTTSNCRGSDGYRCLLASAFGDKGDAVILGKSTQKFCALHILPAQPSTEVLPDASLVDAGMSVQPPDGSTASDAAVQLDGAPQSDAAVQGDAAVTPDAAAF